MSESDTPRPKQRFGSFLNWAFRGIVVLLMLVPLLMAASSPLNDARNTSYIVGALAGVAALALLLPQPLLAAGYLHLGVQARRWHRVVGCLVTLCLVIHVIGLYITSPDDMTDALLLVSPTPFSLFGVVGFWAMMLVVVFVAFRKRMSLSPSTWKLVHNVMGVLVVGSSVIHVLMIEGTMEARSKLLLCIVLVIATIVSVLHLRVFRPLSKRKSIKNNHM